MSCIPRRLCASTGRGVDNGCVQPDGDRWGQDDGRKKRHNIPF